VGLVRDRYTDDDLGPLQRVVADWIAGAGRCGYDHIGELAHRIYENLRGRTLADLVQVWRDGQVPVGVSICGRFGTSFDVLVAPALRGGAVERELIQDAAATTAAQLPAGEEFVTTDAFSCDGARLSALAALGFVRFRTWDEVRERDLTGPLPEPRLPPGFALRSSTLDDADGLAEARNASFGTSWTGYGYRDAVMTRPGYDPSREVVALDPDGRVAAYAVYWTDERNRLGHVEPLGTHRAYRRLGLARAVLAEAMVRMRGVGLTSVSINHDAENLAARQLYASLGFAVRWRTHGYRRPV
jgi:mycothiol synthase